MAGLLCGAHWSDTWLSGEAGRWVKTVIDFKGVHDSKAVIPHALFFYVRYAVSYRELEELVAERGVVVGHATLNPWVMKYSPLIAVTAQARKRATAKS
jgi:putative transposase